MAAAAVLRRPQRERSGSPSAALAAARQRARLAAAVGPVGVAGPLALNSPASHGSSQESSADGMAPAACAWEGGYSCSQGMAPLQQPMHAAGTPRGREHNQAVEGAYASLLASATAAGVLPGALHPAPSKSAPAFLLSPFEVGSLGLKGLGSTLAGMMGCGSPACALPLLTLGPLCLRGLYHLCACLSCPCPAVRSVFPTSSLFGGKWPSCVLMCAGPMLCLLCSRPLSEGQRLPLNPPPLRPWSWGQPWGRSRAPWSSLAASTSKNCRGA